MLRKDKTFKLPRKEKEEFDRYVKYLEEQLPLLPFAWKILERIEKKGLEKALCSI